MLIRRLKIYPLTAAMLVASLAVFAHAKLGAQDGGGGGAVRCEKVIGKQVEIRGEMVNGKMVFFQSPPASSLRDSRKFQILDLWEAQEGYGPFRKNKRTVHFDNETAVSIQVENALLKLEKVNSKFGKLVRKSHEIVTRKIEPVEPDDYVLAPIDTDIRYLPKGCSIVGLGSYWDSKEKLVYDPEVYDTIPNIDKAALEIHEAVYRVLRTKKFKDKTSWRARRITGLMFSTEAFTWEQAIKGFPEDK